MLLQPTRIKTGILDAVLHFDGEKQFGDCHHHCRLRLALLLRRMHAGSNRSLLRSAVNVASVAGLPLRQSITLLDAALKCCDF